jgi:beta-lactamase regulating signal transducer with metallopeptidase domain
MTMHDSALMQVAAWVWLVSWQASVVAALVLLTQWLFRKRLSPGARHALWMLVLVRLALPLSVGSPLSVFNVNRLKATPGPWDMPFAHASFRVNQPPTARPSSAADLPSITWEEVPSATALSSTPGMGGQPSRPVPAHPPASASARLRLTLAWVWIAGVGLLAARLVWQNGRFVARLRNASLITDSEVLQVLHRSAQIMALRRVPRVYETVAVQSPAVYGLLRPRVLLPAGMATVFSRRDLHFVFLHELAHVKRWDMAVNWLVAVLQIAHWFNPVLWFAFARMRTDREPACDALVLSRSNDGENQFYGETIIKILSGLARPTPMPNLVGIAEDMRQMQERMRLIARFRRAPSRRMLALLVFGVLAVVTLTDARSNDSTPALLSSQSATAAPAPKPELAPAEKPAAAGTPMSPLVEDARILIELGKLDEAEIKLLQAVRNNPDDRNAAYYLSLIKEERYVREAKTRESRPADKRGLRRTPGREGIREKLDKIVMERVAYDGWTLSEVVKDLNQQALERDPDKRGVNFIINHQKIDAATGLPRTASPAGHGIEIDATTGLPQAASPAGPTINLADVVIHLFLREVRLGEVVSAVARIAQPRISYSIEDYAVVFTPRTEEDQQLFARTYRVDPSTFLDALRSISAHNPNAPSGVGELMREFFASAGVDFSKDVVTVGASGLPQPASKALFFNDRTGLLLVRATMEDLDIVEKAIQVLNTAPPQVLIEARLLEINSLELKSLQHDEANWRALTNKVPVLGDIPTLGRLFRSESGVGRTNSGLGTTGTLTPKQLRALLQTFEQGQRGKLLAAPRVTTLSGRQIRTQIPSLGFSLDLLPTALADGRSVQLNLDFALTAAAEEQADANGLPPTPLRVSTNAIIWDGQTMLLGPFPSGRPDPEKSLLLLITATLIDPAGNPLHERE